jgi:hypothetical protein
MSEMDIEARRLTYGFACFSSSSPLRRWPRGAASKGLIVLSQACDQCWPAQIKQKSAKGSISRRLACPRGRGNTMMSNTPATCRRTPSLAA